jgi:hypothetical protein
MTELNTFSEHTTLPDIHPAQITIWDELVEQSVECEPKARLLVAGMLSHISLLEDERLIRIGRLARREAEKEVKRKGTSTALVWSALIAACTDEWLRRHPRPRTMRACHPSP